MKKYCFFKHLSAILVFNLLALVAYSQATVEDPLIELKEGNERFYTNAMIHPHQDLARVKELASGQHPFAIIVSCSDSRVSPEVVFDQGLGDIFSIRTAGNVMSDYEEGSIEYAAEHLGVRLIVVLGHQSCGAVKAFLDYAEHKHNGEEAEVPGHIKSIVDKLESEPEVQAILASTDDRYNKAIVANIKNGVTQLRESTPILSELEEEGKVQIVGAIYHVDSGEVEFLDI